MTSHLIWPCSHTLKINVERPAAGLQCYPKNVRYPESWHLDKLQSRHMGTGVSSSHQAKNQPLSPASRLALGGDHFLTIASIHEGRALGSTLNNPSLSWRKQGNSCRVFPVMLLIFKCCSPGGEHGGRGHWNPTLRRLWPIFMIAWLLLHWWTNCWKGGGNYIHPNSK